MSIEPKEFQKASISAALRTLRSKKGARRYLVADEVGLGKTIVASGIIKDMADQQAQRKGGPLSVLYVCSNLAIAKQNVMRLLSFLPEAERKSAVANVDRPSLLPTRAPPSHPRIHIYMLTPETAIPTRKGQRRDGNMKERALALVLLRRLLPLADSRLNVAFQRQAGPDSFSGWVDEYAGRKLGGEMFRTDFRDALRDVLGLQAGQHLPPRLNQMLDEKLDQDLVGACRTALAVAALKGIASGLVIFDEFQRFRDLMEVNEDENSDAIDDESAIRSRAASQVLKSIGICRDNSGPALLLLSATPYTPYRRRSKQSKVDGKSADQSSDFFDLVAFLSANTRTADAAKAKFLELSEELRKGVLDSIHSQTIRESLMDILLPLMSRTERPSQPNGQGSAAETTSVVDAELLPSDISQFCDMHDCFNSASQDWVVPLWQSVPLAMQTLGSRYLAWTNKVKMPDQATLTKAGRDAHRLTHSWPHPRLRALMSRMSAERLSMPWAAPSLPWWPLGGGWKGAANDATVDGKLLVFSRYKAVPTALSGLISYSTESRLLSSKNGRSKANYEAASKRRWLQPSPDRPNLLELFHPSCLLAGLEPLVAPLGSQRGMKQEVERQLVKLLKGLGVAVISGSKRTSLKPWQLLVSLEKKAGLWSTSRQAWETVAPKLEDAESVGRLRAMMEKWDEVADTSGEISEISRETDLPVLVALALESPAVVLLRALSRHWPEATQAENLPQVLSVIWRGLRGYLDKSWFVSALGERDGGKYPGAIRNAVIEGNLESVLDEHFWFLSNDGVGDWRVRLEEVEKSLRLRDASVTFHEGSGAGGANLNDASAFGIRCHVAVPLAEARKGRFSGDGPHAEADANADDGPLRPDEVRKAFNSPFWPNVLVTTSIGQEGLDLHPWCNALAHWDLANSPVALEQREGRITRFGSLSVRRAIALKLRSQLEPGQDSSPWIRLALLAEEKLNDESGLSPWWVVEGGYCKKFFLSVPGGEQQERYESLARERALYRLVLGMPDQADLIRLLDAQGKDPETLRGVCIDLSAYNNKNRVFSK
jgi:hypothetical protein